MRHLLSLFVITCCFFVRLEGQSFAINSGGGAKSLASFSLGEIFLGNAKNDASAIGFISGTTQKIITRIVDNGLTTYISLYPNPVSEQLLIKSEIEISEIQIFDMTGQCLKVTKPEISGSINLSGLDPGSYFIRGVLKNNPKPISLGIILKI
ncbi:MAG: T9SS type A sorting domain-containing protein [Saprospiraceae bacterium]|nr:T9SS type A sorting domain-containing protein [Saprospiraceae bacterium]